MRSMKWFAVALAGGLTFAAGGSARADDDAVVSCCCANLDDVRAQPQAWLWTKFCFEGQFAHLSEIYQPFFTRFDNYDYANFAAWDSRREPSTAQSDFMESFPLLYVNRRAGNQIETLFCLKQFQRFRATAVVQNIFDGKPFIEVIDIVPIGCCCCADGSTCSHLLVPKKSCDHGTAMSDDSRSGPVASAEPMAAPTEVATQSTPSPTAVVDVAPVSAPTTDSTTEAPAPTEPAAAPAESAAPSGG